MESHPIRNALILFLALVFTIGLTFAAVELPYVIDRFLQDRLTTPSLDSHANATSQLMTELFISHYHLRLIGYACFGLTVLLIIVGFASRKSGLAAVGAIAFMLPVFAQFAAVMFFLSGLGILNILWLPVLDVSFELQKLGLVIRAPFDLLMWAFRKIGVNAYWPLVYFHIGGGFLVFFLGTFAWLSAKARGSNVADSWVYRISRHPQYLGWITWSYGMFLLLMQGRYPRRSWGIDASLPWLLSTMIIIGVALLEELKMSQRYGDTYEPYRRKAPFLFPLPPMIAKLFALPFRLFYGRERPKRKREVITVLSAYTALLIGCSALFYGGGLAKAVGLITSSEKQESKMAHLATQIREHPNWRVKWFIARRLAAFDEPAIDHFIPLLQDEQEEVRALSAEFLGDIPSERAVPALSEALRDPQENVRGRALSSLARIGSEKAVEPMKKLLDDPAEWVRVVAARSLAELGVEDIADRLIERLDDRSGWVQIGYIDALGTLRARNALPALIEKLNEEKPGVRRAAVVALMKISSLAACEALKQATHDEDWEVRVYATEALRRLKRASID